MAGRTLPCHRNLAVIPFGRTPRAGAVTAHAVGRGGNVRWCFACRGAAVVTAAAIRGRREQGVIRL